MQNLYHSFVVSLFVVFMLIFQQSYANSDDFLHPVSTSNTGKIIIGSALGIGLVGGLFAILSSGGGKSDNNTASGNAVGSNTITTDGNVITTGDNTAATGNALIIGSKDTERLRPIRSAIKALYAIRTKISPNDNLDISVNIDKIDGKVYINEYLEIECEIINDSAKDMQFKVIPQSSLGLKSVQIKNFNTENDNSEGIIKFSKVKKENKKGVFTEKTSVVLIVALDELKEFSQNFQIEYTLGDYNEETRRFKPSDDRKIVSLPLKIEFEDRCFEYDASIVNYLKRKPYFSNLENSTGPFAKNADKDEQKACARDILNIKPSEINCDTIPEKAGKYINRLRSSNENIDADDKNKAIDIIMRAAEILLNDSRCFAKIPSKEGSQANQNQNLNKDMNFKLSDGVSTVFVNGYEELKYKLSNVNTRMDIRIDSIALSSPSPWVKIVSNYNNGALIKNNESIELSLVVNPEKIESDDVSLDIKYHFVMANENGEASLGMPPQFMKVSTDISVKERSKEIDEAMIEYFSKKLEKLANEMNVEVKKAYLFDILNIKKSVTDCKDIQSAFDNLMESKIEKGKVFGKSTIGNKIKKTFPLLDCSPAV